jgi:hypothetical protein
MHLEFPTGDLSSRGHHARWTPDVDLVQRFQPTANAPVLRLLPLFASISAPVGIVSLLQRSMLLQMPARSRDTLGGAINGVSALRLRVLPLLACSATAFVFASGTPDASAIAASAGAVSPAISVATASSVANAAAGAA